MNLKAIIPSGQTEITVNGLHQWDYGRKLEIHSAELPATIEVHFACSGMEEAVVRTCSVTNGVATADIPDHCIEQTTPIVAWIYCIDDTSGYTERTIIMPIIPRTKPAPAPTLPTPISDKYTELIGVVNEQIGALQNGTVVAGKAQEATHAASADTAATAGHATTAGSAKTAATASTANSATTAGHATTAGNAATAASATKAMQDANGKDIAKTYAKIEKTVAVTAERNDGVSYFVLDALEANSIYAVLFEVTRASGTVCYNTFSGVLIYPTPTSTNTDPTFDCGMGQIYVRFMPGEAEGEIFASTCYAGDDSAFSYGGKLKLYKIGTIA